MRDPGHEGIYIAIGAFQLCELRGDPIGRQISILTAQIAKNARQEPDMYFRHGFAEIGNLANFPEKANSIRILGQGRDRFIPAQTFQRRMILRVMGPHQHRVRRRSFKAFKKGL